MRSDKMNANKQIVPLGSLQILVILNVVFKSISFDVCMIFEFQIQNLLSHCSLLSDRFF